MHTCTPPTPYTPHIHTPHTHTCTLTPYTHHAHTHTHTPCTRTHTHTPYTHLTPLMYHERKHTTHACTNAHTHTLTHKRVVKRSRTKEFQQTFTCYQAKRGTQINKHLKLEPHHARRHTNSHTHTTHSFPIPHMYACTHNTSHTPHKYTHRFGRQDAHTMQTASY